MPSPPSPPNYPERKERQSLDKAEARRDDAEANEGSKKKRKVQKHHVSVQSGSEGTLSATHLHQAEPAVVRKSTPPADAAVVGPHVEKEVVNLSGNTRVPTPEATTQPLAHTEPPVTQKPTALEGHSSQSSHPGHEDEPLVSHLATPTEDEFLGSLSNVEVASRAYQTLDRLRLSLQRATQENEGLSNKLSLIDSAHSECPSQEKELLERVQQLAVVEEKIKGLEHEKLALSAKVAQAEADRHNIVREFIPAVVKRLHTSVEYRQSLAALILSGSEDLDIEGSKSWEAKHRELFTKSYPCVQKVSDSYDLPMDELLKVSRDVPSATDKGNTLGVGTCEASQLPPSAP
ncbi:hypothetical protein Tco_0466457 [Tanacetum coccineum]